MSGGVKCPWSGQLTPMSRCHDCQYWRKEDDAGTIWCTYLFGGRMQKIRAIETELANAINRAKEVELDMIRWRNRGVESAAQKREQELRYLQHRIEKLKEKLEYE